ncbi:MAG TPA: flagellar biosynthetic protein FliQ [Caulifigura sp.]|jgi:flagellar biosynthetic protein FliQ|nr:flagellar biosynthetic protein FliQ [Caulifigura sp.]
MSAADVMAIARDLVMTAMLLSLPAVGASLLVGLVVSILQTVTSVQEQTLSFAPRLVAVGAIILLTLPWSLQVAQGFTIRMVDRFAEAAR